MAERDWNELSDAEKLNWLYTANQQKAAKINHLLEVVRELAARIEALENA